MFEKLQYFFKVFIPEVKGEWKKVTRPNRREVVTTTGVVVVTSFIFAVYLWVADLVIRWAYEGMFKVLGL
ncbi:MAG: preprotein translocase subunit SecE [bacterium]|nr:preprotein translocase subunit SecE [bacterium]